MPDTARATEIADQIAADFYNNENKFDWSARKKHQNMADANLWEAMPEVVAVHKLQRQKQNTPEDIRLFLTFIAAMDRSRDAINLWHKGLGLFISDKNLFQPAKIERMSESEIDEMRAKLKARGVSQKHKDDSDAWHAIGCTLAKETEESSHVLRVIKSGEGDAKELLRDLWRKDGNRDSFPLLRGPKISQMWVRMMADPGGAEIDNLDWIRVAVDTHVRRVSEKLEVADTEDMSLDVARGEIQSVWKEAAAQGRSVGPNGKRLTSAALDPALWFFGKYGCTHCESTAKGQWTRFGKACDHCRLRKDDSSKT